MKKVALLVVIALVAGAAFAADMPSGKIAKYVWVETEKVKPGHDMTYSSLIRQYKEVTGGKVMWIGTSRLAGDATEVSFVSFYDNMKSLEDAIAVFNQAYPALVKNTNFTTDVRESQMSAHGIIWEYQPELSYKPDMVPISHMTRNMITVFQVRPGMGAKFAAIAKEYAELVKKVEGGNYHWLTYRAMAGASDYTYAVVTPMKSLADIDEQDANEGNMAKVFTPAVREHLANMVKETVVDSHTTIEMVRPDLSAPSQEMMAANPDFWTVKEMAPAVATTKGKKAKKPVEPVSMKEKAN